MTPVFLDYESFWSVDHSLTKMSPLVYVMHPATEIQSCAIKIGAGPTRVVFGEAKLRALFDRIDWSDKIVVAHNNEGFDAMISAWRFGIKPAMWGCTLAMARPFFAKTTGLSLAAVMKATGCPFEKGSLEAVNTKGKYLKDFTPDEIAKMETYNGADTDGCAWIFNALAKRLGGEELRLIDATIRMLVEPKFVLDTPLLESTLKGEQERKQTMLLELANAVGVWPFGTNEERVEAVTTELASAPKFSKLLVKIGVEVPMKPSPSAPDSGKMVPALAKTDQAFLDMQEHDDPLVAMAASARLGVKSTLLETRIEKFLEAGRQCDGKLPVPLRYYGADTTGRWSGWSYNPQNLPRVSGKPSDALRNSLVAPPGYKVVVADLSGIELRVNMFLWKVPYAMKLFQDSPDKADLYKYFAAHELYRIEEDEVTKQQRQIGKISHLGLGFGAGPATFRKIAKIMGGVDMSEGEAANTVYAYRDAHPEIAAKNTGGWALCHRALEHIYHGSEISIDPWGMCTTSKEGIITPKGVIRYPNLRKEKTDEGKDEWVYGEGRHKARIYAGKVTENIVQHLARMVIAGNALDFAETNAAGGCGLALSVHDELVYVVPDAKAGEVLDALQGIMRTPPHWWPELVTWSEGDIADTYGSAK